MHPRRRGLDIIEGTVFILETRNERFMKVAALHEYDAERYCPPHGYKWVQYGEMLAKAFQSIVGEQAKIVIKEYTG